MLHIASSHTSLMGSCWHLVMPVVNIPIPDSFQMHYIIFPPPLRALSPPRQSHAPTLNLHVSHKVSSLPCSPTSSESILSKRHNGIALSFLQLESKCSCASFSLISAFKDKVLHSLKVINHFQRLSQHMAGIFLPPFVMCPCYWSHYTGQEAEPRAQDYFMGSEIIFVLSDFRFKCLA